MSEKTAQSNNGFAGVSLVLGIISIVASIVWLISVVLGILAIVFGALSLKSANRKKAIAGIITGTVGIVLSLCIVLAVYYALPALQTSQRDTARKSDISSMSAEITNLRTQNRGQLPAETDINTADLSIISSITTEGEPSEDTALYHVGKTCSGESAGDKNYSLSILLENDSTYCLDM